ncbi:MAG: c-type cytochrome [Alphaproteobacteria bacterium]|nr:c-type cytochrome [Alphaproteobacteria bacterium]
MTINGLAARAAILAGAFLAGAPAQGETLLERGTYLMQGVVACGNCHTPKGGPMADREMAGGFKFDEKPFTAYASNITPDRETGIGGWTDAQIVAAIREGKRPDGSIIGPPMPTEMYRDLSDRDAQAIVAYLRGVKPVRNAVPKSAYRITLPPAWGPPVVSVPEPDRGDRVAYGRYLAFAGHCMECHTPLSRGRRQYDTMMGAGGFEIGGPWGVSISANLTPDTETGLGRWTDAQIKAAIAAGVRPDGTKLAPPMPFDFYRNVSERDLDALVAYLRSLKPVRHAAR